MENLKHFLLISSIVLFVFAFYKWLKRYLRKNDITIPFTYLYPFESERFDGSGSIKFDLPIDAMVRAEIIKENGDLVTVVFEERFKTGIHSKEINLSMVASGNYNLRLCLPDQTITRFIIVSHEAV